MITEVTKLLGIQYPVIQAAWPGWRSIIWQRQFRGRRPWPHRSIGGTGRVGSE